MADIGLETKLFFGPDVMGSCVLQKKLPFGSVTSVGLHVSTLSDLGVSLG